MIETCKLNGVNPQVYFTDLITRLVNGWPQNRIDEFDAVALGAARTATLIPLCVEGSRNIAYPGIRPPHG